MKQLREQDREKAYLTLNVKLSETGGHVDLVELEAIDLRFGDTGDKRGSIGRRQSAPLAFSVLAIYSAACHLATHRIFVLEGGPSSPAGTLEQLLSSPSRLKSAKWLASLLGDIAVSFPRDGIIAERHAAERDKVEVQLNPAILDLQRIRIILNGVKVEPSLDEYVRLGNALVYGHQKKPGKFWRDGELFSASELIKQSRDISGRSELRGLEGRKKHRKRKSKTDSEGVDLFIKKTSYLYKKYPQIFNEAFREDIIPLNDNASPITSLSDGRLAKYYVNKRYRSTDRVETENEDDLGEEYEYERLLNDDFWRKGDGRAPLVFLEGPTGCGKTTLLKYYLNHYCPIRTEDRKEFDKKLVLEIDSRGIPTTEEFERVFYFSIRTGISNFCYQEKEKEDGKPKFDIYSKPEIWRSRGFVRKKFEEHGASGSRVDLIEQVISKLSDKEWVYCVLSHISKMIKARKVDDGVETPPFEYLVICIDDIDRSPVEVQLKAVKEISTLLREGFDVWKAYFPVWANTYDSLGKNIGSTENKTYIQLTRPDEAEVFDKRWGRKSGAANKIASLSSWDVPIDCAKGEGAGKTAAVSSEFFHIFLEQATAHAREDFVVLVRRLAGGSTRYLMDLWFQVLASYNLEQHYLSYAEKYSEGKSMEKVSSEVLEHITSYEWQDALFSGVYEFHNRWKSPVPNLFSLLSNSDSFYDSLIGFHILELFNNNIGRQGANSFDFTILSEKLLLFGYEESRIMEALNSLANFGLVQFSLVPTSVVYISHQRLRGFLDLLTRPAYLDNMAMVTPLNDRYREHVLTTKSFRPNDFTQRVFSTLALIDQIKEDEENFRSLVDVSGEIRSRAVDEVERIQIRSIYYLISSSYRNRLAYLRDHYGYLPDVKATEWRKIMSHHAISDLDHESEDLVMYK